MRREASRPRRHITSLPTVRSLMEDIVAGIRVLQTRDGLRLSEEQILERARNIVAGLIGNYRIQTLDHQDGRVARAFHQLNLLEPLEPRAVTSPPGNRPARA